MAALNLTSTAATNYLFDSQTGRLIFATGSGSGSPGKLAFFDGAWHDIANATTGWQILTWVLTSGGNGEIFRNGTSLGTAAYTAKAIGGTTALFAAFDNGGNRMSADIGDVLLFSKALSTTERQQAEAHLNAIYAIY